MSTGSVWDNKRGISEIYGTLLVIALAFAVSVLIIGAGFLLLDDSLDESNDQLGQDSITEFDNRVSSVITSVDQNDTWKPPDGSEDNFEANASEGQMTLTVRTTDEYWNATEDTTGAGDLVDATTQTNSTTIEFGTLRHEGEDGLVTAYQGGAVFERQGDSVSVIETPDIELSENRLSLSLVEISSFSQVSSGEEMEIQGTPIDANELQQMVDAAIKRDDAVIAEAEINVTIRSEFADGWASYAVSELDRVSESDVTELSDNRVKIQFGTFGEGINVSSGFEDPVIYSGVSEFAPEMHNHTLGTIEEPSPATDPGFEVTDPSDYAVGAYLDTNATEDPEWWVWNTTSNKWENVQRSNEDIEQKASTNPEFPPVPGSGDTFELADETVTCTVADSPSNFDEYVDDPNQDCVETMIGVDNPNDLVADFKPFIEVTNVDPSNPPSGDTDLVHTDDIDVDVTVENTGPGDADSEPVGVFLDTGTVGEVLVAGDRVDTDSGDSEPLSTFTVSPGFLLNSSSTAVPFNVGAATANDRLVDNESWSVSLSGLSSAIEIEDFSLDSGSTTITAGETIEGTVVFNNTDSVEQDVAALVTAGNASTGISEALDPGTTAVSFTLNTRRTETEYDKVFVEIPGGDDASENITVNDPETTPEFEVENVWYSPGDRTVAVGDSLEVTARINNTGSIRGPPQVVQFATTSPVTTLRANGSVSLGPGQATNVTFDWTPAPRDVGDKEVFVFTADDQSAATNVTVEGAPETDAEYTVDIEESTLEDEIVAGDNLTVRAEIENIGNETDSQEIWLSPAGSAVVFDQTVETLSPGASTTVEFTWESKRGDSPAASPPEQDLVVSTPSHDDTETVLVRSPDNDGDLEIQDVSPDSQTVTEGEPVDVLVGVENVDTISGSGTLILENLDGDPVDAVDVSLDAGNSTTVGLTWNTVPGDAGIGNVTVVLDNQTESVDVEVERQQVNRAPLDIAFVHDESGSMIFKSDVQDQTHSIGLLLAEGAEGLTDTSFLRSPGTTTVPGSDSYRTDDTVFRGIRSSGSEEWFYTGDTVDLASFDTIETYSVDPEEEVSYESGTVPPGEIWYTCYSNSCYYNYITGVNLPGDSVSDGVLKHDLNSEAQVTVSPDMPALGANFYTAGNDSYRTLGDVEEDFGPVDSISGSDAANLTAWYVDNSGLPTTVPEAQTWVSGPLNRNGDYYRTGETAFESEVDIFAHGEDAFEKRIEATQQFVGELNSSNDQVGYVQFDSDSREITGLTDDFNAFNSSLAPDRGGGTDITAGIEEATDMLTGSDANPDSEPVIVLLGDGLHTQGDPQPIEAAEDAADENITIYTVGLGENLQVINDGKQELKNIANETGGEFFFADNADELAEKFSQVADNATEVDGPEYQVNVTDVTPTTADRGETVTVTAEVTNVGDVAGDQPVWLTEGFDGTVVDSKTVSLDNGSTKTETLSWEVELSDDEFDNSSPPQAQDELTVRTGSDSENVTLTVEDRPSNFEVDASLVTAEPVNPDEVITVDVTVDNTATGSDEQQIWLRAPWEAPVDSETVSLPGNGGPTTVSLSWNLSEVSFEGDTLSLNVTSDDDSDTVEADVQTTTDVPEFFITGIDTNADAGAGESISAGEDLTVEAEIQNTGSKTGEQFIELRNFDNTSVDGTLLELDPTETGNVTLTWETMPVNEGVDDIIVEPGRGPIEQQTVNITEYDPDASFDVEIDNTNATEAADESIEAGVDVLSVDATITHSGSDAVRAIVNLNNADDSAGAEPIPELQDLGVLSNEAKGANLTYQTTPDAASIDDIEVTVERFDASDDISVNITEQDVEPEINITAIDTNAETRGDAVTAGQDQLNVTVTFQNSSVAPDANEIVSLYKGTSTSQGNLVAFEPYSPNPSNEVTLTWQPLPGAGDNVDPSQVTVTVAAAQETEDVYINEAPDELIGGPGDDDGPDPIGIDVDEIQVSS